MPLGSVCKRRQGSVYPARIVLAYQQQRGSLCPACCAVHWGAVCRQRQGPFCPACTVSSVVCKQQQGSLCPAFCTGPQVRFATGGKDEEQLPPYRLTFPLEAEGQGEEDGAAATPSGRDAQEGGAGGDRSRGGGSDGAGALVASTSGGGGTKKKELLVESYVPPDPGPYPEDKPRTNSVRFTAVQTEAIMSGAVLLLLL
eukprot:1157388-Pelagomonas_calceolata.AAC.6